MAMTKTRKLINALELLGFKPTLELDAQCCGTVFVKFYYGYRYLVGKRAALRRTSSRSFGQSESLTGGKMYRCMLELGGGRFKVRDPKHAQEILAKLMGVSTVPGPMGVSTVPGLYYEHWPRSVPSSAQGQDRCCSAVHRPRRTGGGRQEPA